MPIQSELQINVDKSKLKKDINSAVGSGDFDGAGKRAGTQFGNAFSGIISKIIGVVSTASLINLGNQAVQSARAVDVATGKLTGSLQSLRNQQIANRQIANDTNKSYEERALAIGFNVDKLYEEQKASSGVTNQARGLEQQLKLQERAFEDGSRALENSIQIKERESKAIQRQIDLINRETAIRIKQQRTALGGDVLEAELDSLQAQKDKLEVSKAEAELAGGAQAQAQIFIITNQINQLNKEINLRKEKLDVIDNEAKAIQKTGEVSKQSLEDQLFTVRQGIDLAREQLQSDKNTFELSTQDARRKLEDLRDLATSVSGSTQVLSSDFQKALDQFNEEGDIDPNAIADQVQAQIDRVFNTVGKQAGVTRQALAAAASDIVATGLKDADQVGTALERIVVIASKGSPLLGMSKNVENLGANFRNMIASQGDLSGLQDEYLGTIIPRGLTKLQAQGKLVGKNVEDLTREEQALAQVAGLQDEYNRSLGVYEARAEAGGFETDKFKALMEESKVALGEGLLPVVNDTTEALLPFIGQFNDLVSSEPQISAALFGMTLGATALATVAMFLGGPVSLAIAGVGIVIASVASAWQNNTGGMRDNAMELGNQFNELFGDLGIGFEDVKTLFKGVGTAFTVIGSVIGNIIINLASTILTNIGGVIDIFQGLRKILDGDVKEGLKQVMGGFAKILVSPFDFAAKTIVDTLNGLIDGFNTVNPADKIPNIPRPDFSGSVDNFIQSFAQGGLPVGRNALVRVNDDAQGGQESILNARATALMSQLLPELNQIYNQGDTSYDQSTTNNYYNYGGGGGNPFTNTVLI